MEIWKKILDFENYEISNLGNIKSLGNNKSKKEKVLKQTKNSHGYMTIGLHKLGVKITKKTHILVAEMFLNHTSNSNLVVDHIDNDKLNNKLNNLQLITQRKNTSKDKVNESGVLGVYKHGNKFKAQAFIDGKHKYLGLHDSKELSHKAYNNAIVSV